MSVNTTLYITRGDALALIVRSIVGLSDSKIEDLCYELYGIGQFYNFIIVDEYKPEHGERNWNKPEAQK